MVKELYQITFKETHLKIVQGSIDAILKKEITKSGCRVYDGTYIGIAGTLGKAEKETYRLAEAALQEGISYPYETEKEKKRIRDFRNPVLTEEIFIKGMEEFLGVLRKEYPDFIFSNKVKLKESEFLLKNDTGLEYISRDRSIILEIIIKHIDSIDIMDTFFIYEARELNGEELLEKVRKILEGFKQKAILPSEKKVLVAISPNELMEKLITSLNGEQVGNKTSILWDKLNNKVFHDDFHVVLERGEEVYHTPFFDTEGTVMEEDRVFLIKNGIILRPYTDKKQAKNFQFSLTGGTGGDYDEVPVMENVPLTLPPGDKSLKELFQGEIGILVVIASGGDYTNEGNYATPVQMAYLTDGEKLLGSLPEFNLSSNLFEMFGGDFVGISKDAPIFNEPLFVLRMNKD